MTKFVQMYFNAKTSKKSPDIIKILEGEESDQEPDDEGEAVIDFGHGGQNEVASEASDDSDNDVYMGA